MRDRQQGGATVRQRAEATVRSKKSSRRDGIQITKESINNSVIINKVSDQSDIVKDDIIDKDISIENTVETSSESEEKQKYRLKMKRITYEREYERRRKLIEREKELKSEYKSKLQKIQRITEENNKLESRCRTLKSLIDEIPQIPEMTENVEERTFIKELEEMEQITNPAIIFTDKYLGTGSRNSTSTDKSRCIV